MLLSVAALWHALGAARESKGAIRGVGPVVRPDDVVPAFTANRGKQSHLQVADWDSGKRVRETGAKVDASVAKMVARICRAALLVIDDIGILPAGQESAEAFYRVVDAAYEKTSVILTSNIHPSGFDQIMPKGLASAAVDRFMHHAHVVTTEGSSLRLGEALAGRRVVLLA